MKILPIIIFQLIIAVERDLDPPYTLKVSNPIVNKSCIRSVTAS